MQRGVNSAENHSFWQNDNFEMYYISKVICIIEFNMPGTANNIVLRFLIVRAGRPEQPPALDADNFFTLLVPALRRWYP